MSLKTKTVQSLKWSFAGTAGKSVLQFGITVVLARLLEPKDYGLLALANIFINFGFRFSRMGLGPALIQRKEIDDTDIRASYTLAMAMGFVLGLVIYLAAPLGATIFNSPKMTNVIRVLAFSSLLQGFLLTSQSLIQRNLNYKSFAKIEVSAHFVGNGVVAITCAALGFGVWSLVAGMLTAQLIMAVGSFLLVCHSLMPIFRIEAYRKCLSLGLRFSINSFLDFSYANMNTFFVGFLFGDRGTGLYDRAWAIGRSPIQTLIVSVNRVMFPAYSRLQNDKEKVGSLFLTQLFFQGIFCASVAGAVVGAASEIIQVFLGEKWMDAIVPLKIMVCFTCFEYLSASTCSVLDGCGQLGLRFRGKIFGIVFRLVSYSIGCYFGFHGFLFSFIFAECAQFLLYNFYVVRITSLSVSNMLRLCGLLLAQGAFAFLLTFSIASAGRVIQLPILVVLIAQVIAGSVAVIITLAIARYRQPSGIPFSAFSELPFFGNFFKV